MITAGCERLGIEIPIIQAPMGGAAGPALAAAVSNAGGLGTLALWGADIQALRKQIRETRALTAKPFAVNLNLEFPQEERLDVCLQEGVPVISLFWRDPSALVPRAKAGGAVVLHTVGTAAEARHAVECGVDVVIAQGWEAGGHVRGTVATMALVPAVVDAVGPVPVMAAGGDCRWSWTCGSVGARRLGGLDWNPFSCKQRGGRPSALSGANSASKRRRYRLSRRTVRHRLAKSTPSRIAQ